MKKAFFITVFSAALLALTGYTNAETFANGDLKGSYIYSFNGVADCGPGSPESGNISETGIFTADGSGNLAAVAHTSLCGQEVAGPNQEVWNCTYAVASNGFVEVTCNRTDFQVEGIEWSMVIDGMKKEVRFQASGNQPGFGNVDVQGSGTHQ